MFVGCGEEGSAGLTGIVRLGQFVRQLTTSCPRPVNLQSTLRYEIITIPLGLEATWNIGTMELESGVSPVVDYNAHRLSS